MNSCQEIKQILSTVKKVIECHCPSAYTQSFICCVFSSIQLLGSLPKKERERKRERKHYIYFIMKKLRHGTIRRFSQCHKNSKETCGELSINITHLKAPPGFCFQQCTCQFIHNAICNFIQAICNFIYIANKFLLTLWRG